MSPALPDGEPVPGTGPLPTPWVGDPARTFSVYVHVPFCAVRCGYCDFNTYTAAELGGGANQVRYADTACQEIYQADRFLAASGVPARAASTVFFGGGTPTILPATDLARMLAAIGETWGVTPGAEVTTEANPDSVTPDSLAVLAEAGFTRVSFGMQSAVPHVLATLERTHDPARIPQVVSWARDVGLDVSLDLIYGTPGESLDDWRVSLETAVSTGVDHLSAYALVVEPGTKMGAQVRRGLLPGPDEDDQATKYEIADEVLTAAGLTWYEVSNWARTEDDRCRHNMAYWEGGDWWGIGPGAHSHLGGAFHLGGAPWGAAEESKNGAAGVRWWNVKHPRQYATLLDRGSSPAAGREILTPDDAALEAIMLSVRLSDGMDLSMMGADQRTVVAALVADGLLDGRSAIGGRAVLTLRGRLLADAVVRALAA